MSFNKKVFFKAFVRIPALSYWSPPSLIKKSSLFDKDHVQSTNISFKFNDIIIDTRINEDTRLILKEGVNYSGDSFSPKIEQFTYLEVLKQNDVSIRDFYSDINMFEQFLSLATLQTVRCSEISLYDKSEYQALDNGEKHYHPIKLIYVQRDYNKESELKRYDFLFKFASIAPYYPRIIKKWYAEEEKIAPIREHLIASIKGNKVYTSVDFLIVIQAIEGFWWRFRDDNYRVKNEISKETPTELKIIINELIEEFESIDTINKMDLDVKAAVHSRHYYSHFMNKSKKPKTLDGLELLDLTFKLRIILICCLLNFLGFDNSLINDVVRGCNNYLLAKRD